MRLLTPNVVRIDTLPSEQQAKLIEELKAVDGAVFSDPTPDEVLETYRGENVDACWVWTMRHRGKLVGYNAIRIWFEVDDARRYALWRSRAAVMPAYRRASLVGHFAIWMYVLFRARHPRMPAYTVNTLVHPSGFVLFAEHEHSLYPFPQPDLSPDHRAIYTRAFERLGLERIPGGPDFLVADRSRVRMAEREDDFWASVDKPSVRFFLEHNPDYQQGRAIATFNALTLPNVARIAVRQGRHVLSKAIRRRG